MFTKDDVTAYWDHRTGWWSSGSENPKVNCWGYAFGYDTWVESPEYIYADDYNPVPQSASSGDLIKKAAHVIVVTTTVWDYSIGGVTGIDGTIEKIRSSGIYNKAYFSPMIPLNSVQLFRKK